MSLLVRKNKTKGKINKVREKGLKTREKILKVATKLFAKYGFAGASMDEISRYLLHPMI
ncbi:MAG: hypothetical protein QXU40_04265 [Candidatus Pacearchaeota archaeon]